MDVSKIQIDSITRHDLTGFITCHLAAMVADRMWNKEGEVGGLADTGGGVRVQGLRFKVEGWRFQVPGSRFKVRI